MERGKEGKREARLARHVDETILCSLIPTTGTLRRDCLHLRTGGNFFAASAGILIDSLAIVGQS
jgi:hypothetical protein